MQQNLPKNTLVCTTDSLDCLQGFALRSWLHVVVWSCLLQSRLLSPTLVEQYVRGYFLCADQVCHWVGYAPDKPSKKEAATGMIPRAAALHRHMAFVAHRQRISLLAADRNFDAALGQCRELHQLLRLGAQGAAAMRKHGNLSEDGGGGEPKFFTHDPELGALLLAASLLEADLRWRMHSWEPCYAAYDKVMATPAKAGKTVKPGIFGKSNCNGGCCEREARLTETFCVPCRRRCAARAHVLSTGFRGGSRDVPHGLHPAAPSISPLCFCVSAAANA